MTALTHIEEARSRGLAMLEDPSGSALGAVICLSAHLAAFEVVVEPALLRTGSTRAELRGVDALHAYLGRVLRVLERRASGEVAASGLDRARTCQEAADLTRRAGRLEDRLLVTLAARLDGAAAQELADRYLRALHSGPTRPHPTSRHNRVLRRVNAWRDHALDVMDARQVPLGRPDRPHVVTGRERRGMMDARRT